MGCCGKSKNLNPGGSSAPAARSARKPADVAPQKDPPAFALKDQFSMPIPGGWPLRLGDKVVKASSMQDAKSKLRLSGRAHSAEAAMDNICRELMAMGRPEACRPSGLSGQDAASHARFFEEDAIYDIDPRGPQNLTKGTYGADAPAWARLHLRALDGKLSADYLKYFAAVIGCWKCQRHWYEILKANPLPTNPDSRFAWSTDVHNIVNTERGVSELVLDDAEVIWK